MAFVELGVTHGAIGFYKQIIQSAVANGWSRIEDIEDRLQLGAATVIQTNTDKVDYDVTGMSMGVWLELPFMYLGAFTAYKNFTTPVTEGVDFDISRVRGRVMLKPGGQFDNGAGVGVGRFTMPAGYEIKRGWTVLGSAGANGLEALRIGLRFDAVNANPANPHRCGPRWSLFKEWALSVTDYDSVSLAVRNAAVDDVCQYVHPVAEVADFQMTVTLNRIISMGRSNGYSAWCYAGAMTRFRPTTEQVSVIAMIGNQGTAQDGNPGVLSQTNAVGTMSANQGAAWLYDLNVFSSAANPVNLNANVWTFESGSIALGYTSSRRLLNTPGLSGTPQYYFELHDGIVARNVALLNTVNNVIYGGYDGAKAVLVYGAKHGLEVTYDGQIYRLWSVGSSWTRFVAVAKI